MPINTALYSQITTQLTQQNVTLVAVSKTKPIADIDALYNLGQRDFGENYVQELVDKQAALPPDIRWHFIGHLQSNKVKYIAPFVHLIHGVDSKNLLIEINKQAAKNNRIIPVLLQVHISQEETKFGFDKQEILQLTNLNQFTNIEIKGLMGMASFTENTVQIATEFTQLKNIFNQLLLSIPSLSIISMGMSSEFEIAIQCGSNMVRIGSLLFGNR
jgi:pyridoxal phosphate enzyme (YggS family)